MGTAKEPAKILMCALSVCRKLTVEIDAADKQAIGLGLTSVNTPFFEPIFRGLEFKAKASLVADVQSAHLMCVVLALPHRGDLA